MVKRFEYSLDLEKFKPCSPDLPPGDLQLRALRPGDAEVLAELMIEAYRGTIDYDGETLADAFREVEAYLHGERGGRPLLDESRLAFAGHSLAGACLAADWQERGAPIIAYVMVHPDWKNRGVGRRLLCAVLLALREQKHGEARAVITEGNLPSERIFRRAGFIREP